MKKRRFFILFLVVFFVGLIGFFIVNNFGKNQVGKLEVNSNFKMDVSVDGKVVGKTPYSGTYDPKEIVVEIGNYQTKLQLQSGIKTIVDRDFLQNSTESFGEVVSFEKTGLTNGIVAIVSIPSGAEVMADGKIYGVTPLNINDLSIGNHTLVVSQTGYQNRSFPINVVAGYKLIAAIDLQLSPTAASEIKQQDIRENTSDLTKTIVEILSTPNGFLRVRNQPTTASDEIARVNPGEKYDLIKIDGKTGWFDIKLDSTSSGWISNVYAATQSAAIN